MLIAFSFQLSEINFACSRDAAEIDTLNIVLLFSNVFIELIQERRIEILNKKIAITSDKAGTTRNLILGVYNDDDSQIVFVDHLSFLLH